MAEAWGPQPFPVPEEPWGGGWHNNAEGTVVSPCPGLHGPGTYLPSASRVPAPTEASVPGCGLTWASSCDHWTFLRRRSREGKGHCQASVGGGHGAGTWQPGQATPTRELGSGLGPDGWEGT